MVFYDDFKFGSKWKDGNEVASSEAECAALCLALTPTECMGAVFGTKCVFFNRDGDTNDDGSYKEIPLVASSGKRVMRRECAVPASTEPPTTETMTTADMTTEESMGTETTGTSTSMANNNIAVWGNTIGQLAEGLGDDWNILSMSQDGPMIRVELSYDA